mmetsp:Transcript_18242/g.32699  ORF Transcript_18242/g.32699 Transcript_18242/m.32699 type:complete len:152 (-) Transcript_18242:2085-2540(-)
MILRNITEQTLNKQKKKPVDTTKYKTEMCRNWIENGTCNYGRKCNFAHGKEDLQQKLPSNTKYKSKLCVPFHEIGVCSYGHRCLFVHHSTEEKKHLDNYYFLLSLKGERRSRLSIFEEIAPEDDAETDALLRELMDGVLKVDYRPDYTRKE